MIKLVIKFLITAVAVYLIATLIPGISADSTQTVFIVAALWSLIVMFIRPILRILTFPITLITFGLFSFILNVILFAAMAYVIPGFTVTGVIPAIIGSIALSLASSIADHLV